MRGASVRSGAAAVLAAAILAGGCQREQSAGPPPDARRPVIKSEAELAAERQARIAAGEVVPTTAPALLRPAPRAGRLGPPPPVPGPDAVRPDVLLVNDQAITAAEVLYPLWDELVRLQATQTAAGFRERARQLIRQETQRQIGALLIYREAIALLPGEQRKVIEAAVEKDVDGLVRTRFGGSKARLEGHLVERGLTLEQLRAQLERNLVVREYTREKLLPQVRLRRAELLAEYRANQARYAEPETRELLMIELPFDKFLPAEMTWDRAPQGVRAQARLQAMQRARDAHAALAERPFGEVARQFSLGPHADRGGSFGRIGRPLQAPFDALSQRIFGYEPGQYSEPVELPNGWYIVGCGEVRPGVQRSFVEVQDQIRQEVMERRFLALSTDYVLRLAEKATISALDPFVEAAARKAAALVRRPAADGSGAAG